MEKKYILTVAIPCYNSEEYMGKAIESALAGGDDIEVIVVDDGSKDKTKEVGLEYERQFPDNVRVISKENGGHGSAVNTGILNARGEFYKVLDSDDWLDRDALCKTMEFLRDIVANDKELDMFIANYVYERVAIKKQKSINYHSALPVDRFFTWSEIKKFKPSQNILMHSVIYRTELLRNCKVELPEHTFYVDNIFVYYPLPSVKKMYYMDIDLYRYYIGREDQSVNEKIMMGRIDQQLRVTKLMINYHDVPKLPEAKLRNYMIKYITIMMTICSVFLVKENTKESLAKRDAIWKYLRDTNPEMADLVNKSFLGKALQMRSWLGRKIIIIVYKMSRRIIGFS
ncbi:MAG: glycosyltransferase family 2 protein [Lachnospiraceae bacterium]|nr:glycosyltransferase family 2 protein [Lachnospiraceae bacterium]